jgi:hypothetical protein
MKRLLAVALVEVGFFICTSIGFAQSQPAKYTAQEIYDFFDQYTPQDVMEYANEAVMHFSKIATQATHLSKNNEEKLFGNALIEFHRLPLKFKWESYPFLPFVVPQRCDEGRILAHPNPDFFKVMNEVGFLKKYRDVNGVKVGIELCEKIMTSPNGVWSIQYQFWPDTDKPLLMGLLFMQIPNSPYQIHTFYPTTKFSIDELNKLFKSNTQ